MPRLESLDAEVLRAVLALYRDALRKRESELNRLNVYPVADADTGTNMLVTVEAVMAELDAARTSREVVRAVIHGAFMGGRGNSGIVLSQVLGALARAFEGGDPIGPLDLADAIDSAARAAYDAVPEPVEGTMLTVARVVANAALSAARSGTGLADLADVLSATAWDAVRSTTGQLDALGRAEVVDAGAAGLALLFDGLARVATGAPFAGGGHVAFLDEIRREPIRATAGPRYEIVVLIEAGRSEAATLRSEWAAIGESIAIAEHGGVYKCHVHTDAVEVALDAARRAGRVADVEVTDLASQVEAIALESVSRVVVARDFEAARDLVEQLGAALDGAVETTAIRVGPGRAPPKPDVVAATLPELLAALLAFDPGAGRYANVEAMRAAATKVATAEADSLAEALDAIDRIVGDDAEVVTVFTGADASESDVEAIDHHIRRAHPAVSLEAHDVPSQRPRFVVGVERSTPYASS